MSGKLTTTTHEAKRDSSECLLCWEVAPGEFFYSNDLLQRASVALTFCDPVGAAWPTSALAISVIPRALVATGVARALCSPASGPLPWARLGHNGLLLQRAGRALTFCDPIGIAWPTKAVVVLFI